MTKFQKLNPSYACLFIDHKRRKVHFHYPQKNSTYEMVWIGLWQIWWRIAALILGINTLLFVVYGVIWLATRSTSYVSTGHDLTIPFMTVVAWVILFIVAPPFIGALIFTKNKKLLKIYPEIYTKFCKYMDGYKYVKVTKLKSLVYEIPVFDNTFMDYATTGEFKKYLKHVEIKNYPFREAIKHWRTGKVESDECIDFWKAVFVFTKIPKTGYLEVNYH